MSNVDMHVIAERIADVVNKKIHPKLEEHEKRIMMLEQEIRAMSYRNIETVVRSILSVKLEELAKAVALNMAKNMGADNLLIELNKMKEQFAELVSILEKLGQALNYMPKNIADAVKPVVMSAKTDPSKVASAVDEVVEKRLQPLQDVADKLSGLEKSVNSLSAKISKMSKSLSTLPDVVSALQRVSEAMGNIMKMREDIEYCREVLGMLEERMKIRLEEAERE